MVEQRRSSAVSYHEHASIHTRAAGSIGFPAKFSSIAPLAVITIVFALGQIASSRSICCLKSSSTSDGRCATSQYI
jgi:hypothetical protein